MTPSLFQMKLAESEIKIPVFSATVAVLSRGSLGCNERTWHRKKMFADLYLKEDLSHIWLHNRAYNTHSEAILLLPCQVFRTGDAGDAGDANHLVKTPRPSLPIYMHPNAPITFMSHDLSHRLTVTVVYFNPLLPFPCLYPDLSSSPSPPPRTLQSSR